MNLRTLEKDRAQSSPPEHPMPVSQAREMMQLITRHHSDTLARLPTLGLSAPSSISHPCYSVGYYSDGSILIWAANVGLICLDDTRTYYRDTVAHLARCLGMTTRERRVEIIGGKSRWIDGIHWGADGNWIEIE